MRVIRDAVLVPRATLGNKKLGAGVLQRSGGQWVHVDATGVRRRGREYVPLPAITMVEPVRRIENAVYGGFLFSHYGHFLLESLNRLWFDAVEEVPVVWIAGTGEELTPWMTSMLDVIGAPAEREVADAAGGAIEVGTLLVPDPGFEVQRYLHPWFRSRLGVQDASSTPDHRRLWLSRSALGDISGVAQETEIEMRLEQAGWTVVHAETLPLREQIDLLAGASHIAGIEGSAFHTLLFVRGYCGTIDLITRHGNSNFELVAQVAGWDQIRHSMSGGRAIEWNRPSGARDVRWIDVDVEAVIESLIRSSCA